MSQVGREPTRPAGPARPSLSLRRSLHTKLYGSPKGLVDDAVTTWWSFRKSQHSQLEGSAKVWIWLMGHLRVLATHSRSATPFRKTSARPVRAKAFESTVDMAWTRHGHSGDAVDVAWTSTRLGPAPRRTAAFATHPASLRALASKRICHCRFLDSP